MAEGKRSSRGAHAPVKLEPPRLHHRAKLRGFGLGEVVALDQASKRIFERLTQAFEKNTRAGHEALDVILRVAELAADGTDDSRKKVARAAQAVSGKAPQTNDFEAFFAFLDAKPSTLKSFAEDAFESGLRSRCAALQNAARVQAPLLEAVKLAWAERRAGAKRGAGRSKWSMLVDVMREVGVDATQTQVERAYYDFQRASRSR